MKKYFALIITTVLFAFQAFAQTADLASALAEEPVQSETKTITSKQKKLNANEKSMFSFLNFSFIKKPLSLFSDDKNEDALTKDQTDQTAQSPKKETPVERATRLAEGGDVDAALSLGYMYLYGQDGVQTDYQKAFHFYELAANQNNVIALNNLGSLYFNGIGTNVNYKKAAELFTKSAQLGSDDAAVNLAFIYLSAGKTEYFEPAIKLFEQASDAGNNTAKFMLGYAYYKGFVVDQDYHKAVELIRTACNAKFDEAHYVFAQIYQNGEGIAKNYGNTVRHYRAAVAQGHVESMMALADIYAQGRIAPRSPIQAHILYNIASVYGIPEAGQKRDALERMLKLDELLEAQNNAERYKENPSELTVYIRQTFGKNIRRYIDDNLTKKGRKN